MFVTSDAVLYSCQIYKVQALRLLEPRDKLESQHDLHNAAVRIKS